MNRRGRPAPLGLNLAMAALACQQALVLAPAANGPGFPWDASLKEKAQGLTPPDQALVLREVTHRLRLMLDGIAAWRTAPASPPPNAAPVLWKAGAARLFDYGGSGLPVLVLPSLINRARILDLTPGRSFLRQLAASGLRPLLLDWGEPGWEERGFTLDDYARLRILPALEVARALGGGRAALLGHCMGGTLAAGVASRRPQGLTALVTLGAPWHFLADGGFAGRMRAAARADRGLALTQMLQAAEAAFGLIPAEVFDLLFTLLNPVQTLVKFRRFAGAGPAALAELTLLEDWLADGIPMAGPAARDLLVGWHVEDRPARGSWQLLGGMVDAARAQVPALVVSGTSDHIAPEDSAAPLARDLPAARHLSADTGHIGMIAGSRAQASVWTPVAEFLNTGTG